MAFFLLLLLGCSSKKMLHQQESSGMYGDTTLSYDKFSDTVFYLRQKGNIQETHNGQPLFSVGIKNKKLNGNWRSWYINGKICDSGKLVNNLPDGIWKYWDNKGNLLAVREFSADKYKRVTAAFVRYNNRNNFYHIALLYQKNREAALYYLSSHYSFPGSRRNEKKLESLRQFVYENSNGEDTYTPVFDNSLHHGLYINFFPAGIIKDSGYYKDGLKTGKWVHYSSPTGISEQGPYMNGVRVKDWKIYNQEGKLTEIVHYDSNGAVQWRKKLSK